MGLESSRHEYSKAVHQRITAACFAALIVTAAAACGGENSGSSQPTRTVTSTPPEVTTTAPTAITTTSTPSPEESTSPAAKTRYLSEMDPLTSSGVDTNSAEINGRGFPRSVTLTAAWGSPVSTVEYNISRQWKTFSATIGLRDDSPTGGSLSFEVSVDGREAFTESLDLGETKKIKLNLKDALRLKLTVTYSGQDSENPYYGSWGDARLED